MNIKKILYITGGLMIIGSMFAFAFSILLADILFWTGLVLYIPQLIELCKQNGRTYTILQVLAFCVLIAIGYMFFSGRTIKIPGKEPITIVDTDTSTPEK